MSEKIFRSKVVGVMSQLMRDFPISVEDAAAIMGNLGHESGGLATLQEIKPTVKGSRGGYGWPQWTGPRRRAYEAYCERTGKNPASDEANYAYLFVELKGIEGSEGGAIKKLKAASGLDNKVVAFEKAFLRAGIKHYDSRKRWAKIALDQWHKSADKEAPFPPSTPLPPAKPQSTPGSIIFIILVIAVIAAVTWFNMRG